MGCPVVVTPEVGSSAVVKETGAGMVVPGEPLELAAVINSLIDRKGQRADMGRRGVAAVRERFAWDAIAERMEGAYWGLVEAESQSVVV